ncbi:MAG TPA: ribosome maturation factor RimM [Rickettsiales bacterium]|nr:ribosome maturation factor RimM [Rickettsiales bacterium]
MGKKIVIAKILTTHGVRGFVKLESFMEKPKDIFNYSDNLYDKNNKQIKINFVGTSKPNIFVVKIEGVEDMDLAKNYRNLELYIDLSLLPHTKEEEFYFNELIGLKTESFDKKSKGKIVGIDNFGAGIVVEIEWENEKDLESIPFIKDYFREVNAKDGYVIVERPEYI